MRQWIINQKLAVFIFFALKNIQTHSKKLQPVTIWWYVVAYFTSILPQFDYNIGFDDWFSFDKIKKKPNVCTYDMIIADLPKHIVAQQHDMLIHDLHTFERLSLAGIRKSRVRLKRKGSKKIAKTTRRWQKEMQRTVTDSIEWDAAYRERNEKEEKNELGKKQIKSYDSILL